MAWIKWPLVLAAKSVGGLGVGSLNALNLALLYKWRWRILTNPNALWAKVINSIHGTDNMFTLGAKQNGIWSRICKTIAYSHDQLSLPQSVITRQVGDGCSTRFWKDIWTGGATLASRFPRLFTLENQPNCFISDRFIDNAWKWDWRRTIRGGCEESQLVNLLDGLQRMNFSDSSDSWQWKLNGNVVFSVKDIRKDLDLSLLHVEEQPTCWNSMVPNKVNVFMWRMLRDRRFNISIRDWVYMLSYLQPGD